jgi:hypothetical protein
VIDPPVIDWLDGDGTAENPHQITNSDQLVRLSKASILMDRHFALLNGIDLAGFDWFQAVIPWFGGVFDGNGHVIRNLHIQGSSHLGFFGLLGSEAAIVDLGLEGVDIDGIGDSIGGLAGGSRKSSLSNCFSTGAVSGEYSVGGLVGDNTWGSVSNGWYDGAVSGRGWVGGLVGANRRGRITNCYSTGTVDGESDIGGLAGENYEASVTNCYSTGTVGGSDDVGGLVGENYDGSITNSYSAGTVDGNDYVGGLVGWGSDGGITSSFWDVEASGQTTSAGGIGKTTAEMQTVDTFLDAGWDLVDETVNGTCDYWQADPGGYPQFYYHAGNGPAMPEGLGTAEQPYLIRDAQDLGTVWFEPSAHYRLEASIDLSGITWSMAVVPCFGGTLYGNGYAISNLTIQGGSYLGLFGQLGSGAIISNLSLEAVDVNGTGHFVGGLAAENHEASITKCCSTGTVNGSDHVGGLVGGNGLGSITNCYSTGTVNGDDAVGGLVGDNGFGSITNCYSTGTVNGDDAIGGLVGWNSDGSITASFWDIEASGQTTSAGGISKTTGEMQTAATFLEAGWDFVGETANGTEDIWGIDEGRDYPRLWWQLISEPNEYTLTVEAPDGKGSTIPATGSFSYTYVPGEERAISARADTYYHFVEWSGTAVEAGKVADPASSATTVELDGDYTLRATFVVDMPGFKDAALKAEVVRELGVEDPNVLDMLRLTTLDARGKGITDLSGLEYAENLTWLYVQDNQIANLDALSSLTSLERLYLSDNPLELSAFDAINRLSNLQYLQLDNTNDAIDDLPAEWATNLAKLRVLNVRGNQRLHKTDPWVPAMKKICEGNGGSLLVDD